MAEAVWGSWSQHIWARKQRESWQETELSYKAQGPFSRACVLQWDSASPQLPQPSKLESPVLGGGRIQTHEPLGHSSPEPTAQGDLTDCIGGLFWLLLEHNHSRNSYEMPMGNWTWLWVWFWIEKRHNNASHSLLGKIQSQASIQINRTNTRSEKDKQKIIFSEEISQHRSFL